MKQTGIDASRKIPCLALTYLEILLHVMTDNFDLAVRSLFELVEDQVCIVANEVVEEHRDLKPDQALQITLAVGGADKPASYVIVVTDFGTLCFAINELLTADVAQHGIIILLLLVSTQALHRPIYLGESRRSLLPTR